MSYSNYRDNAPVFNHTSFEWLKTKCNATDEDIEKFKKMITALIKQESKIVSVMDKHGESFFAAILAGFDDDGVLTFRKNGDIIGEW